MLTPSMPLTLFTPEVVSKLVKSRISVEHYLVLSTIINKSYDIYMQYDAKFPIGTEVFQYLHREGFIEKEPNSSYSIFTSIITSKTADLFKQEVEADDWIDEWRELWPKGVTSGGYPVRADLPSIRKKMKAFIKKYNYDKETIFSITKQYLEDKRLQNYSYIKTAA